MKRDWKPGDVALAKYEEDREPLVFLRRKVFGEARDEWVSTEGTKSNDFSAAQWFRLLVIIDPEDREQVELLVDQFMGQWSGCGGSRTSTMQGVLRVFASATPPKPEEPTGLGAVVETLPMLINEDENTATVLIRHNDGLWWANGHGGWHWRDVPAVKVLSAGVAS